MAAGLAFVKSWWWVAKGIGDMIGAGGAAAGATEAAKGSLLGTAAKSLGTAAVGTVAGQAASTLMTKKPKAELPPVAEKTDLPVPKPKPIEPGGVPRQTSATMEDERRRMAAGLPSATQNTFAGNKGKAAVTKKRLLGGGTYGRETTGQ
ncbi:MAG: hypothetical protein PHV59_11965 [Victivallales bacterium]|nr:hypothetical protein [Victivallales bacterium]